MSTQKFANMARLNSMITVANRSVNQHIKLSVKEIGGGLVELVIISGFYSDNNSNMHITSCKTLSEITIEQAINIVKRYSSPLLNTDMKEQVFSYPSLSFETDDSGFTICSNKSHLLSNGQYYNAIGLDQNSALMAYNKKYEQDLQEYNDYMKLLSLAKPRRYRVSHNGLFNHNTTDFCFSDLGRYTEICLDLGYKEIYRLTAKEMLESMFF